MPCVTAAATSDTLQIGLIVRAHSSRRVYKSDQWPTGTGQREQTTEASLTIAILIAAPALLGVACAVVIRSLRGLLPRWRFLGWLPSFVTAVGLGAGCAATAMDAGGVRPVRLRWIYEYDLHGQQRTIEKLRNLPQPGEGHGPNDEKRDLHG